MTRIFLELPSFRAQWKEMGCTDTDLRRLQEELLANPCAGAVLRGTGGVRKLRFSLEGRGKSAGARVIYVDFVLHEKLYLLTAYPKSEKDNLSREERNELKKLVGYLASELETRKKE